MDDERIAALGAELGRAVATQDYERAAALQAEIDRLAGVTRPGARGLRRGSPGAMGLGTDQPSVRRPAGWKPPKKPDLMTNIKPRRETPERSR